MFSMILNGPIKLNLLKPGVEEPPSIIWHFLIMEKLPRITEDYNNVESKRHYEATLHCCWDAAFNSLSGDNIKASFPLHFPLITRRGEVWVETVTSNPSFTSPTPAVISQLGGDGVLTPPMENVKKTEEW